MYKDRDIISKYLCFYFGGMDIVRKYWLGLRYGNKKTKSSLWSFLILVSAFIVCSVIAMIVGIMEVGIIAVFLGVFSFVFWLSLSFGEVELGLDSLENVDNKKEQKNTEKQLEERINYAEKYGKKQVEQLFHKYKVKKYNRLVMIDSFKRYNVYQCPAYIWKNRNYLYFLVLDREPKRISVELSKLSEITYEKGVVCNPAEEYQQFKEMSVKNLVYNKFLPKYYKKIGNYISIYTKNLYVLKDDIKFTNTSAANLFQVCPLPFKTKETNINNLGKFSKEIYYCNILWKDGVFSTEQYKRKVKAFLMELTESGVADSQFQDELLELIQYRFITNEYAQYYLERRKKRKKR